MLGHQLLGKIVSFFLRIACAFGCVEDMVAAFYFLKEVIVDPKSLYPLILSYRTSTDHTQLAANLYKHVRGGDPYCCPPPTCISHTVIWLSFLCRAEQSEGDSLLFCPLYEAQIEPPGALGIGRAKEMGREGGLEVDCAYLEGQELLEKIPWSSFERDSFPSPTTPFLPCNSLFINKLCCP